MSVRMINLVWEHYPEGGSELLTALALADHAHDNGAGIWASVAHLARKTRQSERTLQYHLRRMQGSGWLQLVEEARGGRASTTDLAQSRKGRTRTYRISPAWIAEIVGASVAPIEAASTSKSVQARIRKGATAIAPEPSVNRHNVNRRIDFCEYQPEGKPCDRVATFRNAGRWWCSRCWEIADTLSSELATVSGSFLGGGT